MNRFPHPFTKIAAQYRRWRQELPVVVSNMAQNEFIDNFTRQGYYKDNGMFVHWRATKSGKQNRFGQKSRGILIGKGRLRRAFQKRPDYNTARVVNTMPYAKVHNEGFKGNVNVKAHTRTFYNKQKQGTGKFTKKGKERMQTVLVKRATSKVAAHTRYINMPARPFMVTGKPFSIALDRMLERDLTRMFNKA